MIIIKMRAQRSGVWVPEDRLWMTLIGASLMCPLSVLGAGLVIQYIDGMLGIALVLVCLYINGLGVSTPPYYFMRQTGE